MFKYNEPPNTTFSTASEKNYEQIKSSELVVICGTNNSGKSFLLKKLVRELGRKSSYLGPARYQNFNLLSYAPAIKNVDQKYNELISQITNAQHNIDNSPWNLQQAIAELSNEARDKLFSIMKDLLGSVFEIKYTNEKNEMSQKYISVDVSAPL